MKRLYAISILLTAFLSCRPHPPKAASHANPALPVCQSEVKRDSEMTSSSILILEEKKGNRNNVLIKRAGTSHNITHFNRPQHVFDYGLSPNGKWVFVWHMEVPPRIVSIFAVDTFGKLSSFVPGAGGTLGWTPGNHLFHYWGAGTDCRLFAFYDLNGNSLLRGVCNYLEVSPNKRFLLTIPTLSVTPDPIRIYDTSTLQLAYESRPADLSYAVDASWQGSAKVIIRYATNTESHKSLSISLN